MKSSLRSLTIFYSLGLACVIGIAVGGAMYVISNASLRSAYESRFEASAREATHQLVDPVYRLDAFAVARLRILLADSDPSLARSIVVDPEGRPFGGWDEWSRDEVAAELDRARRHATWSTELGGAGWRFIGPVIDAAGTIHGAAAFEYSTASLRRDLNRTAAAALVTTLLATLTGCLIGLVLARRATRPFSRLIESVQEIGRQRFHTPVRVPAFRELSELSEAIDRMASQLDKTTVSLEEAEAARKEAERANQLKTRFLANLSHEVRTPLHAVVGHTELLRAEGLEPGQTEHVDGVQVAAGSLLRLVEDVLDLSKIESGNLELVVEPFDLLQLVHEVVEVTQARANPGTVDLFGVVAPGSLRHRLGDADRIKQVLVNLVSNALKYTAEGEVILEARGDSPDEVRFVVSDTGRGIPAAEIEAVFQPFARLIDNASTSGSGLGLAICRQLAQAMDAELHLESTLGEGTEATFALPLQVLDKNQPPVAFPQGVSLIGFSSKVESLFRGGVADTSAGERAAIVYLEDNTDLAAVQAMAGDVECFAFSPSSMEEQPITEGPTATAATTSSVTRSSAAPSSTARSSAAPSSAAPSSTAQWYRGPVTSFAIEQALSKRLPESPQISSEFSFDGMTVLIVEDNEVNQLVLKSMLELLGCRVYAAVNGEEGVEAWRQRRPALILMDCSMPVLDGYEATRRIRRAEQQNGAGEVPIFALTAHSLPQDRARCFEVGMNAFLTKPLTLQQLKKAVGSWFGTVAAER